PRMCSWAAVGNALRGVPGGRGTPRRAFPASFRAAAERHGGRSLHRSGRPRNVTEGVPYRLPPRIDDPRIRPLFPDADKPLPHRVVQHIFDHLLERPLHIHDAIVTALLPQRPTEAQFPGDPGRETLEAAQMVEDAFDLLTPRTSVENTHVVLGQAADEV